MSSPGVLVIIAGAAFVLPLVARRVGVPAVVLEILFGVLIGPSVSGVVDETELLTLLAELGFFLLMFVSGLEIDFDKLARRGRGDVALALAGFGCTVVLAYVSARLLGFGLFLTFVLATTSLGLVVPTLRATRRESTELGQTVLVWATLADFLTLLGVTVFALVSEHGADRRLLNIPIFFVVIGAALLGLRRAAWWFPERFERLFSSEDADETGIRASLALMLVFVGFSGLLGIEPILGAFLAGATFAMVFRHRGELDRKLTGFSFGFLIPIFFITVGIRFDLQAFAGGDIVGATIGLFVAAVAVKMLPALLLGLRGRSLKESFAAGALLSARLSLIIAVAELGVELGVIDRAIESAIVLLAVITTVVAPTAFIRLAPPLTAVRNDR